jgi:uncharacterized protein (DUF4415 family)
MKKEYDFSKGKRGASLAAPPGTVKATIRLEKEVVEWFANRVEAAGGGDYHDLMNQALREFMQRAQEPSGGQQVRRERLRRAG